VIVLKSPREIERMRTSCKMVAEILELLKEKVAPGVATIELEEVALKATKRFKAVPAFKGYGGFPYALCCSPNDRVIHGMPNAVPLKDGDILSLDFGILFDDYYGDAAITVPVGSVSSAATRLMCATEKSLYLGIEKRLLEAGYLIFPRRFSSTSNRTNIRWSVILSDMVLGKSCMKTRRFLILEHPVKA